jgi:hypothetical protein
LQRKGFITKVVRLLMGLGQLCFQPTLPVSCPMTWIWSRTRHDQNSAVKCIVQSNPNVSPSLWLPVGEAYLPNTVQRAIHFILSHGLEEYTFTLRIRPSRPCNEMTRSQAPPTSFLPGARHSFLCSFHCVAARIACSMIANTSPLATCSICKQSNTRPNASPLA